MNKYVNDVNKIEFVVTMACTGACKHCSEGDHKNYTGCIDENIAIETIKSVSENYNIHTLMTFGGEPLLYPDVVCSIHKTGTSMNIEKRQVITNGYFSKKYEKIEDVTYNMANSGVNNILLSVDAFHQETIPIEPLLYFAENCVKNNIPIKLNPAWLVSSHEQNVYNNKTREIIKLFEPLTIKCGKGNIIFPQGNAKKYLSEYFDENDKQTSPYEEDPRNIHTISIDYNGDVLNGNLYKKDIMAIINEYDV